MIERVPMAVPITTRVTSNSITSRITNGMERRKLITVPSTALNEGFGRMCPAAVITSSTPSGRPTT